VKKIEALFKPFKLEEVWRALTSLGINEITISEVESSGRRNGVPLRCGTKDYTPDFCPKIKLEVMVDEASSGAVSAAIVEAARTGTTGDGSIFISQVLEVNYIGTEEGINWRFAELNPPESMVLSDS